MWIIHHLQECDQGHHESRIHPPGLLMIYSLHLPQAMRGTTLNEQHKPHSLMSNFSIAYFLEIRIWWFMICLAHSRWWPHYPGVAWSDVTHHPMTRDDNLTWSQTIYKNNPPGGSWNQWKPISNLLLARLRYCYQPKQKLMRLRLLSSIRLQT